MALHEWVRYTIDDVNADVRIVDYVHPATLFTTIQSELTNIIPGIRKNMVWLNNIATHFSENRDIRIDVYPGEWLLGEEGDILFTCVKVPMNLPLRNDNTRTFIIKPSGLIQQHILCPSLQWNNETNGYDSVCSVPVTVNCIPNDRFIVLHR